MEPPPRCCATGVKGTDAEKRGEERRKTRMIQKTEKGEERGGKREKR